MENIRSFIKRYVWPERLYKIILWVAGLLIWMQIFMSIRAEYDDNINLVINAAILSLFMLLTLLVLWLVKSKVLKAEKKATLFFILFCSPVSLALFLFIFISLMGAYNY